MEEKIRDVLDEEGFIVELLACEEPEQVQALFAREGLTLTRGEVMAIRRGLRNALEESDELDEDELDGVAGGTAAMLLISAVVSIAAAAAADRRSVGSFFRRW